MSVAQPAARIAGRHSARARAGGHTQDPACDPSSCRRTGRSELLTSAPTRAPPAIPMKGGKAVRLRGPNSPDGQNASRHSSTIRTRNPGRAAQGTPTAWAGRGRREDGRASSPTPEKGRCTGTHKCVADRGSWATTCGPDIPNYWAVCEALRPWTITCFESVASWSFHLPPGSGLRRGAAQVARTPPTRWGCKRERPGAERDRTDNVSRSRSPGPTLTYLLHKNHHQLGGTTSTTASQSHGPTPTGVPKIWKRDARLHRRELPTNQAGNVQAV